MAPTVFISYSHKDRQWLERLTSHLAIAETEGRLALWDDRDIPGGSEWLAQIQQAIAAARAAVLLISADFLISPFVRSEEIPRLLERRSQGGLAVFPVIVRSCDWKIVSWLERFQVWPEGEKPLASLRGDRREAAMAAIAHEIRQHAAALGSI